MNFKMERHCIISFLTCGQGVSSRAMSHDRLKRIKVTNFKRDVITRDINSLIEPGVTTSRATSGDSKNDPNMSGQR